MVIIAINTAQDSIYGMVYRVGVGAVLSMTDIATDVYVISKYLESEELVTQATAMLAMIATNLFLQLGFLMGN